MVANWLPNGSLSPLIRNHNPVELPVSKRKNHIQRQIVALRIASSRPFHAVPYATGLIAPPLPTEAEIPAPEDIERYFEREWLRSLVGLAVSALEEECCRRERQDWFALFARYDLDDDRPERLTYNDLAREFDMKVSDVTNRLAWVRRGFRAALLQTLRDIRRSRPTTLREVRGEAVSRNRISLGRNHIPRTPRR